MDAPLCELSPRSRFSMVASVLEAQSPGVYRCLGLSPKQEFCLVCQQPLCLGKYTFYDLVKDASGQMGDCHMDEDSTAYCHGEYQDLSNFSILDFCSGLGGFTIGSQFVGMKPGFFVEKNHLACSVLRENFKEMVFEGDIQDVSLLKRAHASRPDGPVQVTAGFPCQPYSTQGDGRGLQDSRGGTLQHILRGAWLLNAQAVLLECVANVVNYPATQRLIDECAEQMCMNCSRLVFDLSDQWPMHRKRFWCLMSPMELPTPTLVPWSCSSTFATLGSILPLDALWDDELDLEWDQDEHMIYTDPAFGHDTRVLTGNIKAATVLHSWGSVARPCPCGCRPAFSLTRLQTGGARGFGLRSAKTGRLRHLHPEEACLLCSVPLDFKFGVHHRAALCLLGQLAAPLQVIWLQSHFMHLVTPQHLRQFLPEPSQHVLAFQQHLVQQVRHRWITAHMHLPRSIHVEYEDVLLELAVYQPMKTGDLLAAERALQGWGQYPTLWSHGLRMPLDAPLHDDEIYHLELRTPKQLQLCPFAPGTTPLDLRGNGPLDQAHLHYGLGDKMLWECTQTFLTQLSSSCGTLEMPFIMYPFRSHQLLGHGHPDAVLLDWQKRIQAADGRLLLPFEHMGHWALLVAHFETSCGATWTFYDGLRHAPLATQMEAQARQLAHFFDELMGFQTATFKVATSYHQTYQHTCGTIVLMNIARLLGHSEPCQTDELVLHQSLLQLQCDTPFIMAWGRDPILEDLAKLLHEKGVPNELAPQRAKQVIAKLGAPQTQQILQSKNQWASLKAAANKPGVMFRLVTADELARYVAKRAKTQHGADIKNYKQKKKMSSGSAPHNLQVDPLKLVLDSAYFKDADKPVAQIPFSEVEAEGRGVALCTTQQAMPFLERPQSISVDALALILVDHPSEEVIKSAALGKIMFPAFCPGTEENTLILGYILQLGDCKVRRRHVGSMSRPDIVATNVIKFQVFKDQFLGDWSGFIQAPIKVLVQLMDSLQLCRGHQCGAECPKYHAALEDSVDGVIFEALCLVRMRQKYGIRVLRDDESTAWATLRPGLEFVDMEVAKIFELCPIPHGTQRAAIVQVLRDWGWVAKPLQPGRGTFHHMSWKVGAAAPPEHMVQQAFDLDVVITQVKDLTPQKVIPRIIASQKTQRHLSMTSSTSAAASSNTDPWQTPQAPGQGDPWARFQPQQGNGKTRLEELRDQLCTEVKDKVRQQLETHAANMEVDSGDGANSAHEARFQALEVGMNELKQQNSKFLSWFHEAGDRMKQTEQAVTEVQTTLQHHHDELQQFGGILASSVNSVKADLTREMKNAFDEQRGYMEALLEKRPKHT
eukprot:Skav223964  [mRNA]  locus=scaffold3540:259469:263778:+ [translate_table: standard]